MKAFVRAAWALGWGCAASGFGWAAEPLPQAVNEAVPSESDNYALTADSRPRTGAPAGKFFDFDSDSSKIFPGTRRKIQVYVPAAYRGDPSAPACLMLFPDGIGFHATTVFDNLIARHELPVIIAVGITPGVVTDSGADADPRFDRSLEFDSMTDRFPRYVMEEVLPAVARHATPDGRSIYLSQNPDDRGTAGASTGGIAAFNLAWQRPESFHRVFTAIGTFVGMRGGERYYVLVRKTEPKPLRVFLQDGAHDVCIPGIGDWWMSNQTMARALDWAGYAVDHAWGAGTHNPAHAAAIFPDAMRWLWHDWPAPVRPGEPGNHIFREILLPGEGWAAAPPAKPDAPLAALPGLQIQSSTVRHNGDAYATALTPQGDGELWLLRKSGERTRLDGAIKGPAGLAFSPDERWLFVAQNRSRWSLNYRVLADGTVDSREPLYDGWVPDWADDSGAGGVCFDTRGYAYVATHVGVQIFDRNGRVLAILPLPRNEPAVGICFGGEKFDILFATSATGRYSRRLKVSGMPPGAAPIPLPKWAPG